MKAIDQATIVFTSRSANEGFARAAAACFAAQLDPTLDAVSYTHLDVYKRQPFRDQIYFGELYQNFMNMS